MFGFVQANLEELSPEEITRYKGAYCGLCRTLGKKYGFTSRLSLSYDLTFLVLLLSSLYEPEETLEKGRCCIHPCKEHPYLMTPCTEYAADMTIALTYYKCLDDWSDDKNLPKRAYAAILSRHYPRVREYWPNQCAAIETSLKELAWIEQETPDDPDGAANCFGRLTAALFVYKEDRWAPYLRRLGYGLGRYIYLADATVDLEQDIKKGRSNPLKKMDASPQTLRPVLMTVLGDASQAFEALPLVQDLHLLRNILYTGLWIQFNQKAKRKEKVKA